MPLPDNAPPKKSREQLEKELREKYGIPKSEKPVEPWVTPDVEQVVRIPHDKLHPFKKHTFTVDKTTTKFKAFVYSIKTHGVTQPVIVRPDGKDQYEIISGHRRQAGSVEAEIPYTPCIIRALNDEQAIQQMIEDNINNRDISMMDLARSLKTELDTLKRQGARQVLKDKDLTNADQEVEKRSNAIVAERFGMSVKQVQRYIALNNLVSELQEMVGGKMVDEKKVVKLSFTPAVEISYIKHTNQQNIAMVVESQQITPSLSKAQQMRKLDEKGLLNADMIDGIMIDEKKEVSNVILSSQELAPFFGPEYTPRQIKEEILAMLEKHKKIEQKINNPQKKIEQEK